MNHAQPKVIAIFIAYNAERSLEEFYREFPLHAVDSCILVDDHSADRTFEISKKLGIKSFRNEKNLGYGGNLKRAISLALDDGADIIVDVHPDGEYDPKVVPKAIEMAKSGSQLVFGNRFNHDDHPVNHGMRVWKVLPITFLSWLARFVLKLPLSDPHQGFRIYTRSALRILNLSEYSDNYLLSFEMLAQAALKRIPMSEIPVSTRYTGKKRGASFINSVRYSLGVFMVLAQYIMSKYGLETKLSRSPNTI